MPKGPKLNDLIKQVFASLDERAVEADDQDLALPSMSELWQVEEPESMDGQVIGGWVIKQLLGHGGMSAVYLVERDDDSIQQQAALKILPVELASPQAVDRFVRERQILVDLDHPHIAQLLDLGVTEANIPWYVMAYFPGRDIITHVIEAGVDLTQKTVLFKAVCEAIAYAHAHGVVHRDIKPGNILVNDLHEVKVLDFGIALKEEHQALTQTGAVLGTPGYMSPEQSQGRNDLVDARSDVFSLGVLFYHMLVGNKPFVADSAAEIGFQIINEEPKPMGAHIPGELQAIVHQCLAKAPEARYATAKHLFRDLNAYLNGDVVSAKPVSWAGYWFKQSKKHPKTSALVMLVLLLTMVSVAFGWYQNHQNNQRLQQAERFVKQAEDIKNQVRRLHMLPLHNVQPAYADIRNQIAALQQDVEKSGANQSGLTDLALGSAYLSMRDFDEALHHLQMSYDKGWQSAELDSQLGHALAVEWSYQSQQAKSIKDPEAQAVHLDEARTRYYQPAVDLLSKAQQQSHYLAGRLAWIEERYDDALTQYQLELEQNPWNHEAAKQMSEVYMNKFRTTGRSEGYDQAIPYMDLSNQALQQAINIGRSDPLNYVSRCSNAGIDIQIKRFLKRYADIPTAFDAGMAACEASLELEPTAFSPWANMSLLLQNKALMLEAQEQPVTEVYQQALEISQRGLAKHPNKIPLVVGQIKPLIALAEAAIEVQQDPGDYFNQARLAAEQAIEMDNNSSEGWKELARVYWALADYHQEQLGDVEQANHYLSLTTATYISEQQDKVSITSHLNAALAEAQRAKLLANDQQMTAAKAAMVASINRRIEFLPGSKNYFSYHSQALADLLTLSVWQAEATLLDDLANQLINKSCGIQQVPTDDLLAFNQQIEQLSQATQHREPWPHCELGESSETS